MLAIICDAQIFGKNCSKGFLNASKQGINLKILQMKKHPVTVAEYRSRIALIMSWIY